MHYFVGWDVGGWHCDKNPRSRDALAVLRLSSDCLELVGDVFRGNIREDINRCNELASIVNARCNTSISTRDEVTIAIDTPLGLPDAVNGLARDEFLTNGVPVAVFDNPYLYRWTERWLAHNGCPPLSAVKDMIGSQTTKGMHLLRKLGLRAVECGVWQSGRVTAIEAYPAPCSGSRRIARLFADLNLSLRTQDRSDAVCCALIAYLFATDRQDLIAPTNKPSSSEGWIWIPSDAISQNERVEIREDDSPRIAR